MTADLPQESTSDPRRIRRTRRRWVFALVVVLGLAAALPPVADRLLASGIEASAIQVSLDAELRPGSTRNEIESVLTELGVHYGSDSERYSGTIPASRDRNWMGVLRVVYVVVELDGSGRLRSATAKDVFTFL